MVGLVKDGRETNRFEEMQACSRESGEVSLILHKSCVDDVYDW